MTATTAAFTFVGFQLFIMLLIKTWRVYPMELTIAVAIGAFLGWSVFPKSVGKCIKIGVITGLVLGYALVIMASKSI